MPLRNEEHPEWAPSPDEFYYPTHRELFKTLCALHDEQFDVTDHSSIFTALLTVGFKAYKDKNSFDHFQKQIFDASPGAADVIPQLKRLAKKRRIYQLSKNLLEAVKRDDDLDVAIDAAFRRALPDDGGVNTQTFWTAGNLREDYPEMRPVLIEGLLRKGEVMNLIASPKMGKSWLADDLVLNMATGRDWFGRKVEACESILVDNELHRETIASRLYRVAEARLLQPAEWKDRILIAPLRGKLRDIFSAERVFRRIEKNRYRLLVLDSLYRFFPKNMDENDNGSMAALYNQLDYYADMLGVAIVVIHHSTKGNQGGKGVMDVGSGGGAAGRATDTHLIMREHELANCVTVEARVRTFPQPDPFVMKWDFPVWSLEADANPAAIKKDEPAAKAKAQGGTGRPSTTQAWTAEMLVRAVLSDGPKTKTVLLQIASTMGLPVTPGDALLKVAVEKNIVRIQKRESQPWVYHYNLPPDETPPQ